MGELESIEALSVKDGDIVLFKGEWHGPSRKAVTTGADHQTAIGGEIMIKRFRQWWAMLMLRRTFAKCGVHVWKYTDEELKAQCREGLRQCVEMLERDELERMYRLNA